jgi:hypothetical protein
MGRGRNAVVIAAAGFDVFGVDINVAAVRTAMDAAKDAGVHVRGWCADLTNFPLPAERFELIVVTRYLQRDLMPALRAALVPGGAVVYETFTTAQLQLGWGPRSPEHLLQPGELKGWFDEFELLWYEETMSAGAVARLVGIK